MTGIFFLECFISVNSKKNLTTAIFFLSLLNALLSSRQTNSAIIVLVYYVVAGLMKKKFKFFLHGFSLVAIISALIEILELFTRPLTLALRLFGNVLAGEILIAALLGICAWGLPLPMMFFEILVACVQALVFTMLTTVYIASAVNEEEG